MKKKIVLLMPMCSRNMNFSKFEDIPFIKYGFPQFIKTIESDEYDYSIYIGIDDDDNFYLKYQDDLQKIYENINVFVLKNCSHNPVRAWNKLFEKAYHNDFDYFFQIADDVSILNARWTTEFIKRLEKQNNIGTVGPCEWTNYNQRSKGNVKIVIENNFVSRYHYEIFQYFFHPEIKNWFCDDWITSVYDEDAYMMKEISCKNMIRDSRYNIEQCSRLMQYIIDGKERIRKFRYRKGIFKKI